MHVTFLYYVITGVYLYIYIYIFLEKLLLEILFVCHTYSIILVYATIESVCMGWYD